MNGESRQGDVISVAPGEEFEIRLASTPSAGYTWQVENYPGELQLVDSATKAPTGAPTVGDPMLQMFRFRATAAGDYTLSFVLKRAWETTPLEGRTVRVRVGAP